ncbi:hypothetical protein BJAS_P3979 [Bathymodiolus japonicus methanotrophic gill symbiont]|uniref:pentapeptide repeat-containing protein n=1 Tax=Bathymodiolus japonicus methanotrophic gill symbiont TaxID=113269 RepID=UPI001B4E53AF|nr:pentapeptide repeat-containing protein [Bathymodiolus japonicus methanotrophic gill symbiont]GFO73267.1 hypothetical protein BJAS_P3979 [Bathymodiolus japonicus methanotrophic gill symbiont]
MSEDKITIQIKDTAGKVLFTHTCEYNTVGATVSYAVSHGVALPKANLANANLQGLNLMRLNANGATFENALMNGTSIQSGSVKDANFINTDMRHTNISNADITGSYTAKTGNVLTYLLDRPVDLIRFAGMIY